MNKNRTTLFLQVDEIDHLTIRYTDFHEPLQRKKAVEMIFFYSNCYKEVGEKTGLLKKEEIQKLTDEGLYENLVRIRNILLDSAFIF